METDFAEKERNKTVLMSISNYETLTHIPFGRAASISKFTAAWS
jgi:hypothetical protein